MMGRLFQLAGSAAVLAAMVTPAVAQDMAPARAERPYRGLFQSGLQNASQSLTLNASLGGGEDRSRLLGTAAAGAPSLLSGPYGYGSAALSYSISLPRVAFGASGATSTRLYSNDGNTYFISRSAGLGVTVQATRSLVLNAGQAYSFAPYNLRSLSPTLFDSPVGQLPLVEDDAGLAARRYTRLSTSAGATQTLQLTRRSSVILDYDYARTHVESRASDFETHRAGGIFRQAVTQNLGYHVGYHYRRADYPSTVDSRRLDTHEADIGIDFNKALSLTRRTTVSMSTGSSAYQVDNRQRYRVNGTARLNREIGRTWSASLAYNRNIGFVDTFDDPVLFDSVTAGIGGLFMRRLQFSASTGVSNGTIGLTGRNNGYRTYSDNVSLTTSLTRNIAIGTSYFYYRSRFESGAVVPEVLARQFDRQGVRAYLTIWAPLFYRTRRP
jgi:hypothetical protein